MYTTSGLLPAFETENPMLMGWLCQFTKPTDAEAAVAALNPAQQPLARNVVDYLQRGAMLVAMNAPEASPHDETEALARARHYVRLLARSVYETACDILAFGPHVERELTARTGIGVEDRLLALLAATDGLRHELKALRPGYLAGQLRALGLSEGAREIQLHIGCGQHHIEGWVNVDVHPAPLAMNVLWGLPFADASARYVFLSHLLEHLFYPHDVRQFLAELRRVLAPGGVLRVVVPDIEQCIDAYVRKDEVFFASRRETFSWWSERGTRLEEFLAYAGAGPEPAWLFEAHKYGYDFETLHRILTEAGFTNVIRSSYMASAHGPLRVDDASAVAKARYGERYYSLFVEAQAP